MLYYVEKITLLRLKWVKILYKLEYGKKSEQIQTKKINNGYNPYYKYNHAEILLTGH